VPNKPTPARQAATILVRQLPTPRRIDSITATITDAQVMQLQLQGRTITDYIATEIGLDDSFAIRVDTQFNPPALVAHGSRVRAIADVRIRGRASRSKA